VYCSQFWLSFVSKKNLNSHVTCYNAQHTSAIACQEVYEFAFHCHHFLLCGPCTTSPLKSQRIFFYPSCWTCIMTDARFDVSTVVDIQVEVFWLCHRVVLGWSTITSEVTATSIFTLSTVHTLLFCCCFKWGKMVSVFNRVPRREDVCVSGGVAPRTLILGPGWRWVVSFTPLLLYPREGAPSTRWIGGCVGPRAGLGAVTKRISPFSLLPVLPIA
jgi:hypothetical protein